MRRFLTSLAFGGIVLFVLEMNKLANGGGEVSAMFALVDLIVAVTCFLAAKKMEK